MELSELVNGVQIVDLTANTRTAAIRALVNAADWEDEGISSDQILAAVEEREATAQTIVDEGFAMPQSTSLESHVRRRRPSWAQRPKAQDGTRAAE